MRYLGQIFIIINQNEKKFFESKKESVVTLERGTDLKDCPQWPTQLISSYFLSPKTPSLFNIPVRPRPTKARAAARK